MRPVIITCAVTGAADTTSKNKAVPATPEEIANACITAAQAGAASVHIHVRDPATGGPSMNIDHYTEVVERIRASDTDVLINLTTGPGQRFEPTESDPRVAGPGTNLTHPDNRMDHVLALRPDICSLDVSTMNSEGAFGNTIMINTPGQLRYMAEKIRAVGTKPELEIFDVGHAMLASDLVEKGFVDKPAFFQFALGIRWGAPATAESISMMRSLIPDGSPWAAFGISRESLPTLALSVAMGGHARVGLEDNIYLRAGELAPSNAALVEQAVSLIDLLGCRPASPDEARQILNLSYAHE